MKKTPTIDSISIYDGDTLIGVWDDYTVEADTWITKGFKHNADSNIEPSGNIFIRLSGKVTPSDCMIAGGGNTELGER